MSPALQEPQVCFDPQLLDVADTKWINQSWHILNRQYRIYVKVLGAADKRAGISKSQPAQPVCGQPADPPSRRPWLATQRVDGMGQLFMLQSQKKKKKKQKNKQTKTAQDC
jgi:hypothetical protein